MRHVRLTVLVVLLATLALVACQHRPVDVAGQTLMSMGLAYDAAMSTLAALYKEGVVSKEDVEKAIEIARKFYVAYHAALDIYVVWLSTQSAEDSQRLKVAIEEAANFLGNLRTYISILRGGNK